jgi:hypothetical protein
LAYGLEEEAAISSVDLNVDLIISRAVYGCISRGILDFRVDFRFCFVDSRILGFGVVVVQDIKRHGINIRLQYAIRRL